MERVMNCGYKCCLNSIGLLLMRLSAGAMMFFGHGLGKIQSFSEYADKFPDPLGVGNRTSMILAIIGEAVAPALVAAGLLTRFAATFTIVTMCVAVFWVHGSDPLFIPMGVKTVEEMRAKEMALLYLIPFAALLFTGPGKIAIDALIFRGKKQCEVKVST